MKNIPVREYLLGSELMVNRRCLSWIQLCGFNEQGSQQEYLDDMAFGWVESATYLNVSSVTDTLDAIVS